MGFHFPKLKNALKNGTSVVQVPFLLQYELDYGKDFGTSWYRSKDKQAGKNPLASYMINKKWTMEEEFNNHILRFHQVIVSFIFKRKIHFAILGWIGGH